jgi:hypothetical protein
VGPPHFTETSTNSWSSRLGGALVGIVIGLVLFVISFPLLWWNEGRSVDRVKTLDEGLGIVQAVSADKINPKNEKALIHISGMGKGGVLNDDLFGVSVDAIKLNRRVEMYQWEEEVQEQREKEVGGSETVRKTYRYKKIWNNSVIDSSKFRRQRGHENPSELPVDNTHQAAARITVGAFELPDVFVNRIDTFTPMRVTDETSQRAAEDVRQSFVLSSGKFYYGDPRMPKIGDTKVSFNIVAPQKISVVGKQAGSTIDTYQAKRGDLALLKMGSASANELFSDAKDENTLLTWGLRLGGFIAMWAGMAMFFGPIRVLADILPFLGNIIGAGISLVTGLIAFVLSFVTIAMAWIAYRPLLGITLLVVAGAAVYFGGRFLGRRSKAKEPVPA